MESGRNIEARPTLGEFRRAGSKTRFILFRSHLEFRAASFFDDRFEIWEYEPEYEGNYTPDFFVKSNRSEKDFLIEVKPRDIYLQNKGEIDQKIKSLAKSVGLSGSVLTDYDIDVKYNAGRNYHSRSVSFSQHAMKRIIDTCYSGYEELSEDIRSINKFLSATKDCDFKLKAFSEYRGAKNRSLFIDFIKSATL